MLTMHLLPQSLPVHEALVLSRAMPNELPV
jgi:hypothetical protein